MSSSGNINWSNKTNRRIMPPNCVTQNNGTAHQNPSGFRLSSSPIVIDVQQYQAPTSSTYESNYVQAGVSNGVTNSQFGGIQALEAVVVLNWNGFLRIQINDSHSLTVGNVLTIDQLSDVPYAVLAVIDTTDFVISAPYSANAVVGEFFFRKSNGEIVNDGDAINIGRSGGVKFKPKKVNRVRTNNITKLIRNGQWNMQSGYFSNANGTARIQPTYSNAIASGIKSGSLGAGDTSTGGTYQRLGSGFMTMNIVGNSGSITTYQIGMKTN